MKTTTIFLFVGLILLPLLFLVPNWRVVTQQGALFLVPTAIMTLMLITWTRASQRVTLRFWLSVAAWLVLHFCFWGIVFVKFSFGFGHILSYLPLMVEAVVVSIVFDRIGDSKKKTEVTC